MEVRNDNLETVILNYWSPIVDSRLIDYKLDSDRDNRIFRPLMIHKVEIYENGFGDRNGEDILSFAPDISENTKRENTTEITVIEQNPISKLQTTFTPEKYFLPEDTVNDFVSFTVNSDFQHSDYLFSNEIATEDYNLQPVRSDFPLNPLAIPESTTEADNRLNYAVLADDFVVNLNNEDVEETEDTDTSEDTANTAEISEPNDTIANVTETGINGEGSYTITSEIGDNSDLGDLDVDLFAVFVDAGNLFTARVSTENQGTTSSPTLKLFSSEGLVITPDRDFTSVYEYEEFNYLAETSNTYYVGISNSSNWSYDPYIEGSGDSSYYGDSGTYNLSLNVDNVDRLILNEPNDIIINAINTEIALNREEGDGQLYYSQGYSTLNRIGDNSNVAAENDIDLFAVTLNVGDLLVVDIDSLEGLDAVLTIFDSEGTLIRQKKNADGNSVFLADFFAKTDGIYYLSVSSEGNINYDPNVEDSGNGGLTSGLYDIEMEAVLGTGEVVEESNDTIFEATNIELDREGKYEILTTIGDNPNVATRDDVDIYEISLNAGDRFSASLFTEYWTGVYEPVITFFDSACQIIGQDDFRDLESNLDAVVETDGIYYLGISGNENSNYNPGVEGSGTGSSSGAYLLNVNVENALVNNEIDDTIANVVDAVINSDGRYRVSAEIGDNPNLAAENDVDLYAVFAEAGSNLFAEVENGIAGGNLNAALSLFDSEGRLLFQNDDDIDFDATLEALIPTTGTYYIGVASNTNLDYDPNVEGSGTGSNSGFYDLSISVESREFFEEPNDTIANAINLDAEIAEVEERVLGSYRTFQRIGDNPNVAAENDVDLYAVSFNSGDRILASSLGYDGENFSIVITLFDSAGTVISQIDENTEGLFEIDFTSEIDDTYYLGVSSNGNLDYDPNTEGSGTGLASGFYNLYLEFTRAE